MRAAPCSAMAAAMGCGGEWQIAWHKTWAESLHKSGVSGPIVYGVEDPAKNSICPKFENTRLPPDCDKAKIKCQQMNLQELLPVINGALASRNLPAMTLEQLTPMASNGVCWEWQDDSEALGTVSTGRVEPTAQAAH